MSGTGGGESASPAATGTSARQTDESDRYHWLFESIEQGVLYQNAAGEVLDANPAAVRMLGLTLGQTYGHTLAESRWRVVYEDGSDFPRDDFPAIVAIRTGRQVGGVVMGVFAPDTQECRWLKVSATPQFRPGEAHPWQVYTIFDDISLQRREHEATTRVLQREQEVRARLEATLEALQDAVVLFDDTGSVVQRNRAARDLLGLPSAPPVSDGDGLSPSVSMGEKLVIRDAHGMPVPHEQWPMQRVLRGEMLAEGAQQDYLLRTARGENVLVTVSGSPMRYRSGRITGGVIVMRDVTERRRLEQQAADASTAALARADELEATLEAMTDAVFTFDEHGSILLANSAATRLLELDTRGRGTQWQLRDSSGRTLTVEKWPVARIVNGETLTGSRAVDVRLRRLDGTDVELNLAGAPRFDADGHVLGGVCVCRDVGASRRLERDAAERVAQLEAIFAVMTDGVFLFSADGHIREANRAGQQLLGTALDLEQLQRASAERNARYRIRDESGQPLASDKWPVQRLLRGERLTGDEASEFVLDTLDGRTVEISFSGAPVLSASGELTGAVGVLRDVTLTRRRDRQNRLARKALLQIASVVTDPALNGDPVKLLPALTAELCTLDAVDNGFAMLIDERNYLEPLKLCGATPEQESAWAADVRQFDPTDPAVAPRVAAIRKEFDAGRVLVQVFDAENSDGPLLTPGTVQGLHIRASITVPVRVDGKVIGLLDVGRSRPPEQGLSGDLLGVGGFAAWDVDLMEGVARLAGEALGRAALTAQLNAAEAARLAAEEATRQRDEFLGIAGHEMRTPMTSSRANVQLADRSVARALAAISEGSDPQRHLEQVQLLLRRTLTQIDRQARLVDDLLDVSRIQEGRLELRPARFDLALLVGDVVDEQRLAHPGRTIAESFDPQPVSVFADADRIGQVIVNYLTNALKYSSADTSVTVRLASDANAARVEVMDEGPGLSPEQQAHLWERFQRVPGIEVQSGSGIGLGLGLYICRELIERHSGQVGVESSPGVGSTFWFTLPLADSAPAGFEADVARQP